MSADAAVLALLTQLWNAVPQLPAFVGSLPAPIRHVRLSCVHCAKSDDKLLYAC
jgi:hypothetical protein